MLNLQWNSIRKSFNKLKKIINNNFNVNKIKIYFLLIQCRRANNHIVKNKKRYKISKIIILFKIIKKLNKIAMSLK